MCKTEGAQSMPMQTFLQVVPDVILGCHMAANNLY